MSARSRSISAPLVGLTSSLALAISARKSGSFMVASKAARNATLRSSGTPGAVKSGRPSPPPRQQHAQDLPLLVAAREVADQRYPGRNVRRLLQREHREEIELP